MDERELVSSDGTSNCTPDELDTTSSNYYNNAFLAQIRQEFQTNSSELETDSAKRRKWRRIIDAEGC